MANVVKPIAPIAAQRFDIPARVSPSQYMTQNMALGQPEFDQAANEFAQRVGATAAFGTLSPEQTSQFLTGPQSMAAATGFNDPSEIIGMSPDMWAQVSQRAANPGDALSKATALRDQVYGISQTKQLASQMAPAVFGQKNQNIAASKASAIQQGTHNEDVIRSQQNLQRNADFEVAKANVQNQQQYQQLLLMQTKHNEDWEQRERERKAAAAWASDPNAGGANGLYNKDAWDHYGKEAQGYLDPKNGKTPYGFNATKYQEADMKARAYSGSTQSGVIYDATMGGTRPGYIAPGRKKPFTKLMFIAGPNQYDPKAVPGWYGTEIVDGKEKAVLLVPTPQMPRSASGRGGAGGPVFYNRFAQPGQIQE